MTVPRVDGANGETQPLLGHGATSEQADSCDTSNSPHHGGDVDDSQSLRSATGDLSSSSSTGRHVSQITKGIAACISFLVLGLSASSTGALISPLERHYNLTDGQASLIFLSVPVGYVVAAHANDLIHAKLGQIGMAAVGSLAHVVSATGAALHPPFPVFLVFVAVGGLGYGVFDGSLSTWAATVDNANTMSGFLHAAFSVGAAAGPSLVGMMLALSGTHWYQWYYIMIGASFVELVALSYAFRFDNAQRYAAQHRGDTGEVQSWRFLKYSSVWVCAVYLLAYVGTETAISGWIVVFMRRARGASPMESSACSSAFWAGMAVGRLVLGPVNDKFGVSRAVALYTGTAMGLVVVFAMVEVLAVSVVLMALVGFFFGPLFPSSIVYLAALLPAETRVMAVSFVASMGQIGAAGFPAVLGLIAERTGIRVFQVVIFAQMAIVLVLWVVFTRQRRA